jgi:Icc-related predicted phosphoesterase
VARSRIFFATDIHGSDVCFRKFVNAADFYGAKVLILGGDITGKTITPIIHVGPQEWRLSFLDEEIRIDGEKRLRQIVGRIGEVGSYPYVVTPEEYEKLRQDPSGVAAVFDRLMHDSVSRWVRLAEERLRGTDVQIYVQPGNDDTYAIDEALKGSDVVQNPDGSVLQVAGRHEMVSLGLANMTPWHCPRDVSEDEMAKRLADLASQVRRPELAIYNVHAPPYGTGLDLAPKLDATLTPRLGPGGRPEMVPVGSRAVLEALQTAQPLLGLHGHIHESKAFVRIGRTLAMNPGSEYQEGILRGLLLELEGNRVRDHLFVHG